MIDTVILTLSRDKVTTLDNSLRRFPEWIQQNKTKSYTKWIKNMPKQKKETDLYYPRLTGYKRWNKENVEMPMINIEFSAPKLIFNNNLDEVEEKDFDYVVKTLKKKLLEMGESVEIKNLENADISAFHPSKNIVLSDGYRAYGVLKELGKINLTKKLELTKVNFKNDGKALQMYAINHSIVFYDKLADLNQNKKKAVDEDQTLYQRSLFEEIKENQPALEVLRMEIRLSHKQKLNSIMLKLGFPKNPTFREVFRKDVCQKIVRHYWDTIVKGENLFLFELENGPSQLLADIIRKEPKIKLSKAINLVGLSVLCKDAGIRALRDTTEKHINQRNWYLVSNNIKLLNKIADGKPLHSWVKQIEDTLTNFVPYRTGSGPP
ncbi:MAG: hypothetical protein Q7J54_00300 [Candidatus Woesearchaeota archaeon]|nr:hypothetical protein [Candidatus Woesearchaeota archaeon]